MSISEHAPSAARSAPERAALPLLRAQGLRRSFADKEVLRGLDLDLRAGEVVGLLAPNGSGKSTLLDVLAGVTEPDAGRVQISGRDVTDELSARRGVFYVPQSVKRYFAMKDPALFCYLPELSVRDNLLAQQQACRFASSLAADRMLARFGLRDVAEEKPGALSAGMQQRLALARAVGSGHPVLLLDEPLASVDRPTRLRLLRELTEACRDRAVLYVTHDPEEVRALGGRTWSWSDPGGEPPVPRREAPRVVPIRAGRLDLPLEPPPEPAPLALRDAARAVVWEALGTAVEALARPAPGRRGLAELLADLADRMRAEADRLRGD